MTTLIVLPFVCSAAVLAASSCGLHPLVMTAAFPLVAAACWVIA